MSNLITLNSTQDDSVNWVTPLGEGQANETRLVYRGDRAIIYLSSQTACNQGCHMCHLTATKQTVGRDLDAAEILASLDTALNRLWCESSLRPAPTSVHVNFMARGEFFANKLFQLIQLL